MQEGELEALRRDLAKCVGSRHVSVADASRWLHGRDAWPRTLLWERGGERRYLPDVVVWPGSTDEVAAVVRYARERHLPITPFGGGTGMVGGAVPMRAGITLDLKRLDRVLQVDLPRRRASAQAGIIGERLEQALARHGATMGHVPGSLFASTLGGWIATRGAGHFATHYGKIEDMVLGLTAVAGTGEIVRAGPERSPGPDLVQLLVGSEGTLAVVTEAAFGIHRRPLARSVAAFRFRSFAQGVEAARRAIRAGLRPHLLRLYDPMAAQLQEAEGESPREISTPVRALIHAARTRSLGYALSAPSVLNRTAEVLLPRCVLLVAFEGEAQAACEDELRVMRDVASDDGGVDLGEEPARHWYRRRFSPGFTQSTIFLGHAWVDAIEVAATWDRVQAVYEQVRRAVWHDALVMCQMSHSYLEGGSLYFTMVGAATSPERGDQGNEHTMQRAAQAAVEAGATLSHQHGVGAARARLLPDELGDAGMRLLRALKATFDPDGILNPGKLVA